jgi:cell division protein FtsN
MRRIRTDVSHRVRRRPSIFSARWFRALLGAGVALVLVLLIGPWVAGWFGSDLPRSLFLLAPWSAADKAPPSGPAGVAGKPVAGSSVASPPGSSAGGPGIAGATAKAPAASAEGKPGTNGRTVAGGPAAVPRPTPVAPASPAPTSPAAASPALVSPAPASQGSARAAVAPASPAPLATPPSVYWVQVGAFLDHKNADRLAERLRGEGLPAATAAFEQSRVLYRVLLAGPEDGASVPEEVVGRVKGLGHTVEATADGPAVTGAVPLRKAVETSHALRQQGFRVRLKQQVSSSTFRVVKVGSFPTVAEAEAALASLTAKGVEGVVVRER